MKHGLKFRKIHSNEPLQLHAIPERDFQKLGIDVMYLNNENYLIINDYFSKWIAIGKINNKSF